MAVTLILEVESALLFFKEKLILNPLRRNSSCSDNLKCIPVDVFSIIYLKIRFFNFGALDLLRMAENGVFLSRDVSQSYIFLIYRIRKNSNSKYPININEPPKKLGPLP